jgi:hypothetical protein
MNSEKIPLEKVQEWIRWCGYEGKIPSNFDDAWKLYYRLAKERRVTANQLRYLSDLGYTEKMPQTMYEASVLIDRQKYGKNSPNFPDISSDEQRKIWIEGRREEFKEAIEEDIEASRENYDLHGEEFRDDFRLVGWHLDVEKETRCPKRKELNGLIYLAQIQTTDIVEHLPPFDDCPDGCSNCSLENAVLDDIPIKGKQYNIRYVQWDSPKFRALVPKHIFKVFNNSSPFTNVPLQPSALPSSKKSSALFAVITFVFGVIFKAIQTLFRFACVAVQKTVEFERQHHVFQKITSKIVEKTKELGLPFVLIGIVATLVLLVLVWLVFRVF